jgi:hypothetical protein
VFVAREMHHIKKKGKERKMEMFVVFIAVNLMAVSMASVLGDLSIG